MRPSELPARRIVSCLIAATSDNFSVENIALRISDNRCAEHVELAFADLSESHNFVRLFIASYVPDVARRSLRRFMAQENPASLLEVVRPVVARRVVDAQIGRASCRERV